MSKTSIDITINDKNYKYDFENFGFYAMATAEKQYGLTLDDVSEHPLSTMLSLFAFVAKTDDKEEAGKEIDEHIAKGGEISDLIPLLNGFANSSFFQSRGKKTK